MNIVVIGAHPDDPESGCGGLAILAANAGCRVMFLYLSSGVPGVEVNGHAEHLRREEEARAACAVCKAEPHFFRYPASDIPYSQRHVKRVSDFLRDVDADMVLTHWPVDTHPDHQVAGALGTQTVVGNPDVALAYYEVATGIQTLAFQPNRYVDISEVAELKKQATFCHISQDPGGSWWKFHDVVEQHRFREARGYIGKDAGRAEAYYLVVSTPQAQGLFQMREWLQPSGSRTVRKSKHERVRLCPDIKCKIEE